MMDGNESTKNHYEEKGTQYIIGREIGKTMKV